MSRRLQRVIMAGVAVAVVPAALAPFAGGTVASAAPAVTQPAGYRIVSAGFSAASGVQANGSVSCPPTSRGVSTYPQSGGVTILSSSVYANVNSSYPAGQAWEGFVDNDTASTFSFTVYAVCAVRKTGYVVEASPAQNNPGDTQSTYTEPCPAGTKILGGGAFGSSTSIGDSINDSHPSGNAWTVDYNNATTGAQTFTVYAVCSKYSTKAAYQVVIGSSVTNPGGAQTEAVAQCASGSSSLGGGVYSSGLSTQVNLNSTYPQLGAWASWENNATSTAETITPYVICAT